MTSAPPVRLPLLRSDLIFHAGPMDADGSPTFILEDPVQGRYEKVSWEQAEILRALRRPVQLRELMAMLRRRTTLQPDQTQVLALCADAMQRGLTRSSAVRDPDDLEREVSAGKTNPLLWLFSHGIFFRVPLLHPDEFLGRTLGLARLLVSPPALAVYLLWAILGIAFLAQQVDSYLATFTYFFSWQGALCYALAYALIKAIHEFAHAYTAKAYGNRVPTMGLAFMLFMPLAFCDVTDSWKMRSRSQRLLISLAGVLAELAIAALALFGWGLAQPGITRSLCFVASSVTLASTLLVNLNPAMRYDGYYVLSDLLAVDNLQPRAFALTRWALHKALLGIDLPCPEDRLGAGAMAAMILYSAYAWIYRFFLYLGIAAIVYHALDRAVGAVMFLAVLLLFIAAPVFKEMIAVVRLRSHIRLGVRLAFSAAAVAGLLWWSGAAMPRSVRAPAITVAPQVQVVYAPHPGFISQMAMRQGMRIDQGQALLFIESKPLEQARTLAAIKIRQLQGEYDRLSRDESRQDLLPEKRKEIVRVQAEKDRLEQAIAQNRITADFSGEILDVDESLRDGVPVQRNQIIGRVINPGRLSVVGYLGGAYLPDLQVGQPVLFRSDADTELVSGRVESIAPVRAEFLEHAGLSSLAGGEIAVVRDQAGRLEVIDAVYKVEIELDRVPARLRFGQPGSIWFRTLPRSHLGDLLNRLHGVLIRESRF